jgi:hypothetical protein
METENTSGSNLETENTSGSNLETENTPDSVEISSEEKTLLQSILNDSLVDSVKPEDVIPDLIQFIDRVVMPPLDVFVEGTEAYVKLTNFKVCGLKLHHETPSELVDEFKGLVKEVVSHNTAILQAVKLFKTIVTEVGNNLKKGGGFRSILFLFVLVSLLSTCFAGIPNTNDAFSQCYKPTAADESGAFLDLSKVRPSEACKQQNSRSFNVTYPMAAFQLTRQGLDVGNPKDNQLYQEYQDKMDSNLLKAIQNVNGNGPQEFKIIMQQKLDKLNNINLSPVTQTKLFMPEFQELGRLSKTYDLFHGEERTGKLSAKLLECVPNSGTNLRDLYIKEDAKKALQQQLLSANTSNVKMLTYSKETIPEENQICLQTHQETNEIYREALAEMFSLRIRVESCTLVNREMVCNYVIEGGMMNYNSIIIMLNNYIDHLSSSSKIAGLSELKGNPKALFAILAEYAKQNAESFFKTPKFAITEPIWMVNIMDKLGELVRSVSGMSQFITDLFNSKLDFLLNADFVTFYVKHFQVNILPEFILAATNHLVSFPAAVRSLLNRENEIAQISHQHFGPSALEKISNAFSVLTDTKLGEAVNKAGEGLVNIIATGSEIVVNGALIIMKEVNQTAIEGVLATGKESRELIKTGEKVSQNLQSAIVTGTEMFSLPIVIAGIFIMFGTVIYGGLFMANQNSGQARIAAKNLPAILGDFAVGLVEQSRRVKDAYNRTGDQPVDSTALQPTGDTDVVTPLLQLTDVVAPQPPPPPPGDGGPPSTTFSGTGRGEALYNYVLHNAGINTKIAMYYKQLNSPVDNIPTYLKIYTTGAKQGKKGFSDKVTKQKGNNFESIDSSEEYSSIPGPPGGGGTRKHKKRIGGASKHHKKRRRGTKKPSKKRRATRRKRR